MEDPRCCGTGTCIIDAQGQCWCGQRWDGEKMCRPARSDAGDADPADAGRGARRTDLDPDAA